MHIMEGFLPLEWAVFWLLVSLPIVVLGFLSLRRIFRDHPEQKTTIAISGAFIFVLSSLKLPSVTGSSSHPTGTGFSAILYGPGITSVLCSIVLVFQAILLSHGGLTTLGANIFSMGIAGPAAAYLLFKIMRKARIGLLSSVFAAALVADLATYVVTSVQLALAFPGESFIGSLEAFLITFAVTQIPLAIAEGIIFAIFADFIVRVKPYIFERSGPSARAMLEE
ncbi:MAG TPA: energy-coupling factor ABC transporter permease [Methanomassiliicoccales archaeon]|nr:energy-coupling factor ABC transporter permease [Methanomassiliicoccales archaeon]